MEVAPPPGCFCIVRDLQATSKSRVLFTKVIICILCHKFGLINDQWDSPEVVGMHYFLKVPCQVLDIIMWSHLTCATIYINPTNYISPKH